MHRNISFTGKRYTYDGLIKDGFVSALTFVAFIFLCWIFFPARQDGFILIVAVILIIKYIFDLATEKRAQHVLFDNEAKEIVITYKSLLSKEKKVAVPFGTATLESEHMKVTFGIVPKRTLYLLKGKMEVFRLTKQKDGFNEIQLDEIIRTAESHSIPIVPV